MYTIFKKRWLYHVIFWVCYYSWYCYFILYTTYQIKSPVFYLQIMLFYPFDICLVYFNFYVLIPRFLKTKKYFIYACLVFTGVFIDACVDASIRQFYAHLGVTSAIYLAKQWIENQRLQSEREKTYLQTELNFLKTQINPHFFFNTLNNLYSLALNRSEQTPEVILKLSHLMSYMLYESNEARVSLEKEVNYLQDYADLEKLRFGQRLTIHFEIEGNMEGVLIPPMILILFVENCFKHGLKDNIDQVRVDIELKVQSGCLFFSIKNPVSAYIASTGVSGIGLKNVRRRLDLLFQTNYELIITDDKQEYAVSLKMPV